MKRRREGEWERCSEGVKKKVRTRKIKYGGKEESKRTGHVTRQKKSNDARVQESYKAIKQDSKTAKLQQQQKQESKR